MADPHKKKKVRLPPRRGLIKFKILSNIVKLVARAGRRLGKKEQKAISEETQLPQPHDSNGIHNLN
ncbi:hypothetical protein Pint_35557 [Pistacia integerrima]|uniref:Uncharacterized protein n=1 Tax=Pistacia integerrima TaxID=434235 RepID=A0ACC0Y307_9ROSI|nr:hypothetical protein Pint_35557 [Pistacia integerrima]